MTHSASQAPTKASLPLGISLGWASGTLGMAVVYQALNVLLLRYIVDIVGIAAGMAGMLLAVTKIADAVVDPMVGIVSDRSRSRWGRRRPFMLAGGFVTAIGFVALFSLPTTGPVAGRVSFAAVALIVTAFGYAILTIPYLAMPAEMCDSPQQRKQLISFRVIAVSLGGLVASSGAPIIIMALGGGGRGHSWAALMMASVMLVTTLTCFVTTARARATVKDTGHAGGLIAQLRFVSGNRPFMKLMIIKFVSLVSLAMTGSIMPFLFVHLLGANYQIMGIFALITSAMLIASQPLWVRLSRHWDNRTLYWVSTPITLAVGFSWLFAGPGEPHWALWLRAVLVGGGVGGAFLATQTLLPDVIEYDYRRTGLRREGIFAGVYTTVEKLSGALAASLVGLVLSAFGYQAAATGAEISANQTAIYVCLAIAPMLQALSCLFFIGFSLDLPPADQAETAIAAGRGPGMGPAAIAQ